MANCCQNIRGNKTNKDQKDKKKQTNKQNKKQNKNEKTKTKREVGRGLKKQITNRMSTGNTKAICLFECYLEIN